ncbi:leucyl aminopeptidase [Natronincola peptidivorans]|uniref:Probable cytosol aminopeptidase n=1 Tax=Natronincola peptidivorans TaxID=426128 RepID=A0A1H9ZU95_9FIRM|nr:leucyl aminopeptidase [Natronincola peptidivorans]SES85281.1 leucyl aminopeptidase [Natronincola peptidivorans]
MMKIRATAGNIKDIEVDGLIIGMYQDVDTISSYVRRLGEYVYGTIKEVMETKEFKGKEGEVYAIRSFGGHGIKKVFLLGLGKEQEFKVDTLRRAVGAGIREIEKLHCTKAAIAALQSEGTSFEDQGQAISEGALLGLYKFNKYKSSSEEMEKEITELIIWQEDKRTLEEIEEGIRKGEALATATIAARDMVNEPSNTLTPNEMEARARRIAQRHGLEIKVLEEGEMEDLGMGCFLGVAKGSDMPPKLIEIRYNGNPQDQEVIGLVGKGLTFDSGGISLKPSEGMDMMKGDMGGAATVLGAMEAIGALKPKVNVLAVVGVCENMPSGRAYKPGDILTSMKGKTVEILNTDAEGRLVLADCISYAIKEGVTKLVDVATLTGACLVALGTTTTALITNNDEWVKKLKEASEEIGEKVWQLPSFPEYRELIKSDIADLKNVAGRNAGTITAGLFLGEFVDEKPWIHMDIAGTSMNDKTKGYLPKGATGVAVRALYQLVKNLEQK